MLVRKGIGTFLVRGILLDRHCVASIFVQTQKNYRQTQKVSCSQEWRRRYVEIYLGLYVFVNATKLHFIYFLDYGPKVTRIVYHFCISLQSINQSTTEIKIRRGACYKLQ